MPYFHPETLVKSSSFDVALNKAVEEKGDYIYEITQLLKNDHKIDIHNFFKFCKAVSKDIFNDSQQDDNFKELCSFKIPSVSHREHTSVLLKQMTLATKIYSLDDRKTAFLRTCERVFKNEPFLNTQSKILSLWKTMSSDIKPITHMIPDILKPASSTELTPIQHYCLTVDFYALALEYKATHFNTQTFTKNFINYLNKQKPGLIEFSRTESDDKVTRMYMASKEKAEIINDIFEYCLSKAGNKFTFKTTLLNETINKIHYDKLIPEKDTDNTLRIKI